MLLKQTKGSESKTNVSLLPSCSFVNLQFIPHTILKARVVTGNRFPNGPTG